MDHLYRADSLPPFQGEIVLPRRPVVALVPRFTTG
jgi:hypothetical protein